MSTRTSLEAQLAITERTQARLLEQLAVVDAYGDDVWPVGTVIAWHKQYAINGPTYTYAAIKAQPGWYITGRDATTARSWASMVLLFTERGPAPTVLVCTELTELANTTP